MKIEINIPDNKVNELCESLTYSIDKDISPAILKNEIYLMLMSFYEIGAIEKARDTTKPVIDPDMFEVR